MIKLFQQPHIAQTQHGQMGIFQVIRNLYPYLAERFTFVDNPTEADIILSHAGAYQQMPLAHQGFIAFCHGLHPTGSLKMGEVAYKENRGVIDNLIIADRVIVPSEWVAKALRRDMLLEPVICHWGVNLADWQRTLPSQGYVLWNKNRDDQVCSSQWMQKAAALLPHRQFLSTFGVPTTNVKTVRQYLGKAPNELVNHADMKPLIHQAGVYLATTKETGDIGSREALASGVPVVAFAQGAVLDFLQHGVNGYLARVDDVADLAKGIEYCFTHRNILSQNAQTLAQGYTWDIPAQQIINLIEEVYQEKIIEQTSPLVSIVIPCHNYGQFVKTAIESVTLQEGFDKCELLVIDDASTDNSLQIIQDAIEGLPNAQLIPKPVNQGVAKARNTGVLAAKGKYILALDADDMLNKDALKILATHLELDRSLGVAFGYIANIEGKPFTDWLTKPFDYNKQVDGTWNQIPTCCMYRRQDAMRVGLYRPYMQPAEDADLFTRLITFTGKRAQRVIDSPTFFYRMHNDSLSRKMKRDPYRERGLPEWGKLRPLAAPPSSGFSNPVRAYDKPIVQVQIVGKGDYSITLDALYEQTFWNWTLDDNSAPLVVRVEAGKWLGKTWLQELLANVTLDKKDDGISLYEIQAMACCGRVNKMQAPSEGDLLKVRWIVRTHNNPIPSFTGKRNAAGGVVTYRGDLGDELYVYQDDYNYMVKGNKGCWEIVPEVAQIVLEPEIKPAPIPVLIPTVQWDGVEGEGVVTVGSTDIVIAKPDGTHFADMEYGHLEGTVNESPKQTVVIPEFSTLQNDAPPPRSTKRRGRRAKVVRK